jgi:hypothetical protein
VVGDRQAGGARTVLSGERVLAEPEPLDEPEHTTVGAPNEGAADVLTVEFEGYGSELGGSR